MFARAQLRLELGLAVVVVVEEGGVAVDVGVDALADDQPVGQDGEADVEVGALRVLHAMRRVEYLFALGRHESHLVERPQISPHVRVAQLTVVVVCVGTEGNMIDGMPVECVDDRVERSALDQRVQRRQCIQRIVSCRSIADRQRAINKIILIVHHQQSGLQGCQRAKKMLLERPEFAVIQPSHRDQCQTDRTSRRYRRASLPLEKQRRDAQKRAPYRAIPASCRSVAVGRP